MPSGDLAPLLTGGFETILCRRHNEVFLIFFVISVVFVLSNSLRFRHWFGTPSWSARAATTAGFLGFVWLGCSVFKDVVGFIVGSSLAALGGLFRGPASTATATASTATPTRRGPVVVGLAFTSRFAVRGLFRVRVVAAFAKAGFIIFIADDALGRDRVFRRSRATAAAATTTTTTRTPVFVQFAVAGRFAVRRVFVRSNFVRSNFTAALIVVIASFAFDDSIFGRARAASTAATTATAGTSVFFTVVANVHFFRRIVFDRFIVKAADFLLRGYVFCIIKGVFANLFRRA